MNTPSQTKVLVVDDDKVVLKAVTQILLRAGFQIVAISEPVEGLAAAKDPTVDVAIFDITMPNLSGLDLLRAIKAERPELEVIIMTAYATVKTAMEAVKLGAYDYLTKPFDNIDDVIPAKERAEFMAGYKSAAGLAIEQLNKAPQTIASGAHAQTAAPVA